MRVPKTDWYGEYYNDRGYTAYRGDYFTADDFNRIADNIEYCGNALTAFPPDLPRMDYSSLITAETMTLVERDIGMLCDAIYTKYAIRLNFSPKVYHDLDYFWGFDRLNEMERLIAMMYNIIENKKENRTPDIFRRLPIRLNGGRF